MAWYVALEDLAAQCGSCARLKKAAQYLAGFDPAYFDGKRPGFSRKMVIAGEALYAVHQVYRTRSHMQAQFEAHRRSIDIQVVWRGEELIPVAGRTGLIRTAAYDPCKDIEFFRLHQPAVSLIMRPGMAAVLYPSDAHAPCITHTRTMTVAKTVVKVRV